MSWIKRKRNAFSRNNVIFFCLHEQLNLVQTYITMSANVPVVNMIRPQIEITF